MDELHTIFLTDNFICILIQQLLISQSACKNVTRNRFQDSLTFIMGLKILKAFAAWSSSILSLT